MRKNNFKDSSKVGIKATKSITGYLYEKDSTIDVQNVERHKGYQKIDIDLLWKFLGTSTNRIRSVRLEIKGDTYERSLNCFIEIISNLEKNTPGCFKYTEADFIYYYFIHTGELFIFDMKIFKPWFELNEDKFPEAKTMTEGEDKETGEYFCYTTVGKLVPKEILTSEAGVRKIELDKKYIHEKERAA